MAQQGTNERGVPVAYFDVYRRELAEGEETIEEIDGRIPIYPNQEFFFGRSPSCRYQCSDLTISNKHLHIHCIIFEEDMTSGIPPLIYAEDFSANGTYLSNHLNTEQTAEKRISRRGGGVLLKTGDILRIGSHILLAFAYTSHHYKQTTPALNDLQLRESQLFKHQFAITDQKIGTGGHGTVFVAIHKKSNYSVACKVIDLRSYEDAIEHKDPLANVGCAPVSYDLQVKQQQLIKHEKRLVKNNPQFREFDILKDLDHPNIIKLEKVFWSTNTLYIFQELVTGGDLFSFIEHKGGRLSDVEAAVVIRQVLKAVEYLHGRGIVHRDLKPDNILMTSWQDGARIVLTDFGNARRVVDKTAAPNDVPAAKQRMYSVVGTLEYAAPEIHQSSLINGRKQGYSKAIDMWSIGIIATALFTGDVIFTNRIDPNYETNPKKVILSMASKCDLSILDKPYSPWRLVGNRPKDFIKKLLVLEESKRLTVQEALAHEWFTNKLHVDDFEAVYERAIQDWEPRRKIFRLVEALDLSGFPKRIFKTAIDPNPNDSQASHYFGVSSNPECRATAKSYSSVFSKRAHTPLPKIHEENTVGLYMSNMSSVEEHTPIADHMFRVESSMSQLALETLSKSPIDIVLDSQLTASVSKNASTEVMREVFNDVQVDNLDNTQWHSISNAQRSSLAVEPPSHLSHKMSECDTIADTPPVVDLLPADRKRRSNYTSEERIRDSDDQPDYSGISCGAAVKVPQTKRARVI